MPRSTWFLPMLLPRRSFRVCCHACAHGGASTRAMLVPRPDRPRHSVVRGGRGDGQPRANSEPRRTPDASRLQPNRPDAALSRPDRDPDAAIVGGQRSGGRHGHQSLGGPWRPGHAGPAARHPAKPELRVAAARLPACRRAGRACHAAVAAEHRTVRRQGGAATRGGGEPDRGPAGRALRWPNGGRCFGSAGCRMRISPA